MSEKECPLPVADPENGLTILKGLLRERSLLSALTLMHAHVGDVFQITMPRFQPAVAIGPQTNRQILVSERDKFLWRNESDPVVRLLRRGVLIVDGEEHDHYRSLMDPPLQRRHVNNEIDLFWRYTNQIVDDWQHDGAQDMLVEMRKVALLILMGALFKIDFAPDMQRLWKPILQAIEYISPGLWIMWANMPRPKYRKSLQTLDQYLYAAIQQRREDLDSGAMPQDASDLLGELIRAGLDDDRIRDQMLTMLIAGHDTSTALLAWVFYLLGVHPDHMQAVTAEVDATLSRLDVPPTIDEINHLHYLDQVIKEALRMFPPIHIGNRRAAEDLKLGGYDLEAGTRVMYSIYLSHRDEKYWDKPEQFCPARFERHNRREQPPLTYIPFGGGPRNCIGAAFAQVESKVVLARIFQLFDLKLLNADEIKPHMGATLEPRPGVKMRVRCRTQSPKEAGRVNF